jgi:hypothetical protein
VTETASKAAQIPGITEVRSTERGPDHQEDGATTVPRDSQQE